MKKQQLLLTISRYFFLALMVISIGLTVVFYLNAGKINSDSPLSMQINQIGPILNVLVNWAYILAGLSVFFMVGFPFLQIISNPKSGLKALISIGILAILMFVAYQLGDGTVMDIAGYTGGDNVPSRLKMTDMIIFSTYGMVVAAIIVVLYAEISKLFK